MRIFSVAALSFLAVAGLACSAGSPASGSNHDAAQTDDAVTSNIYATPKGIDTTRVYFGTDNILSVDDTTPIVYALVDVTPKSKVSIDLTHADDATSPVGFKLFHVTSTGKLQQVAQEDGPKGDAQHVLNAKAGGTYVIEVVANEHPATLKLDLGCSNSTTHCAPKSQVGEICGGIAGFTCDQGLDCVFAPGSCHIADAAGSCALPTTYCPQIVMPVCGCDGQTYTNSCYAAKAGVPVDHDGACACDETVYTASAPVSSEVVGDWAYSLHDGSSMTRASLTLADDGTFSETITRGPYCEPGHPCPFFAMLVGQASGTYKVTSNGVTLKATKSKSQGTYPTSFTEQKNCKGDVQLVTSENDVVETFTHPQ